jgi:dipeptidyl aminopeptidase/acylaminoacyl peptidase
VVFIRGANPSISDDGRWIAVETRPDGAGIRDVFVADVQTGVSNLVSISADGSGPGNGDSFSPLISGDGKYVVFASRASNLVPNDTNHATDLFVRDRLNGTTFLVSQSIQGTRPGNAASMRPVLGADGRTVVFKSFASDLITGDFNDMGDIFVLRLGDPGAVLRVITLSAVTGGPVALFWSAVEGKTYRVQYKDSVDAADWTGLPGTVTATSPAASYVDSQPNPAQRFYRVMLVP